MQDSYRCSTGLWSLVMHQHLTVPSLARGEALGWTVKGWTEPTSWGHCVSARCRLGSISSRTPRCMTGCGEDTEQNYKAVVVSPLAVRRTAGTGHSVVPRCPEVPAASPPLLRLNTGAIVRAAQCKHYTGLQNSMLNDFLFTTGLYYLLKNE